MSLNTSRHIFSPFGSLSPPIIYFSSHLNGANFYLPPGAEHQESRLVFNDRPELVYLYEHGLLKAKFILIALCKLQHH